MGEQRTSGLGGDLDLLLPLCNTDTGYCFTQYNIFCTKLDSKCVKLNSTCGKYAVNSYGKAYSMIMKLGSSIGLFLKWMYLAGEPGSFGRPTGHPTVHNRDGT